MKTKSTMKKILSKKMVTSNKKFEVSFSKEEADIIWHILHFHINELIKKLKWYPFLDGREMDEKLKMLSVLRDKMIYPYDESGE